MKTRSANPLTIGYLASNIVEGNGHSLWQGIKEEAQAQGIRLVTFAGIELRYPKPFYHQDNQVYELVDRQQLDGLIVWSSSLASFIGYEGFKDFCQHYHPLPMVGIGMPFAGIPSVLLDSYQGMRAAITHLVQIHGKRHIAFISGPELHYEAQERLRAYHDVVAEFGLESNPDLISPPCRWDEQDAAQAMRLIREERGVQFDGVAAVNDNLAYGVMTYLQGQGLRPPEDYAIVGFDNSTTGRVCSPPLTTVPNRIRERGQKALSMLLARINGEEVPEVVILPASIKIRQSCGCQDPFIVQASMPPGKFPLLVEKESPEKIRSYVLLQLQRAVMDDPFPRWPAKLLNAFKSSLDTQTSIAFLSTLNDLVQASIQAEYEIRGWHAALSELRRWVVAYEKGKPDRLEYAERLIHQGRVMVGEISARSQAQQEWLRNRQLRSLLRLRQGISACETLDNLMDILARELPNLGFTGGCLALYVDNSHPLEGVRLALAFKQGRRLSEIEGQVFVPATQLVPPFWLDMSESLNLVVHPLNFGAEQLGFMIVQAGVFETVNHQLLREQIGSAVKNVLLIEQNMQLYRQARLSQQMAEEANALKSRFLSMVSHELLTPIVLLVGLSEMMLREGIDNRPQLPEPYRQDLTRIHASSQQLGSLVRDVLDLTRSQMGQLALVKKPIRLEETLDPVKLVGEQMASSKGLEWRVNLPEHLPFVLGDASRLQQVVLNLVNNAIKFTSEGSVSLTVTVDNGAVTVAITDTGLSVPVAEQQAIFDEFRQSERTVARGYGGLGIGLAICRQIIELHGGKIGVSSTGVENSGSTFYFILPTLPVSVTSQPAKPSQVVLILTEQEKHSLLLCQHLERHGFQVRVLNIGQNPAWLDEIQANQQGALVLDFTVTERGWEIMETIKKVPGLQDWPVIFYSLAQEQDRGTMLALDYMPKPVATDSLDQALQRYGIFPSDCNDLRTVLIVDDNPEILMLHARLVEEHLPTCQVLCANNGLEAMQLMKANPPALVLLDLMMPEMDGMAVLKAMQEDKKLRDVPVIVLTAQQLKGEEMTRLNQGVEAVLAKGIYTARGTLEHIEQALNRSKRLGSENQRLVRKVMAYIHEHFPQPLNRKELADYAGFSERHLNRCFLQETGITPLTYLNRYRIQQATKLLEQGQLSITETMSRVGFSESSHFTRLFFREIGVSPSAFKKGVRP
jgi:signal transduction histidine kinase/DNA-binding LacI/PurR family transcriptional regulator/CheY-like chemotaxis protein